MITDECRIGMHTLCGSRVCECSHHKRPEPRSLRRLKIHRMSDGKGQFAFAGYIICGSHIALADRLEASHPTDIQLREWYLTIARCERCTLGTEPTIAACVFVTGALKMGLLTEDEIATLDAEVTTAKWRLIQARREKGTAEEDMV